MSIAVRHAPLISEEEYLAGEAAAETKHEFLNGVVYAIAGGTMRHSALAVRLLAHLYGQFRGTGCQPYNSDLLLRVRNGEDTRFYYPDATIHCGPLDESRIVEDPAVIFEVLPASTARTDTGEKRLAYLTIPALEACVLIDSERRAVTVWRRRGGEWAPEVFTQPEDTFSLPQAGCTLSVAAIYEGTGL